MKYHHLLQLLFVALMVGDVFSTILVNTGGIHQHSSNAYSTLLSRLRSSTEASAGGANSPTQAPPGSGGSGGSTGSGGSAGSGGSSSATTTKKPLPNLTINSDVNVGQLIKAIQGDPLAMSPLSAAQLATSLVSSYYANQNLDPFSFYPYEQYGEPYIMPDYQNRDFYSPTEIQNPYGYAAYPEQYPVPHENYNYYTPPAYSNYPTTSYQAYGR
ncbi:uncharacterized protein LOC142236819 [Haematobia irritans]|uniref:uncharacterized protein LOC142236819 n=1 Tax=Haematobia irritans TaxID=7368 RepID=UPI003F504187